MYYSKLLAALCCSVFSLVFVNAPVLSAAEPVVSFFINDATGQPGESVQVPVSMANSEPVQAFSLAFSFEGASLFFEEVLIEGTAASAADYLFFEADQSLACAGVVMSGGEEAKVLEAGESREIARIRFTIKDQPAGVYIPVDFEDEVMIGAFPVRNLATIDNADVYPDLLEGGMIEVIVPSVPFLRGDANVDGAVNIADPITVLSYLFSGYDASCLDALDADDSGTIESIGKNGDKAINVSDAIYLLQYLFNSGEPPAPPFNGTSCGEDPTPDLIGCTSYPPCEP